MENKYTIRNCPCFFEETEEVDDYTCSWGGTEELACQDCTDCILKQIVQILEREPIILDVNKEFEQMYKLAKVIFAKEILAKLDIKRVK